MSAERPKRSRKIVNYGEDHLHWVEEAQLQKALLRSLADNSPTKKSPDEKVSTTFMKKPKYKNTEKEESTKKAKSNTQHTTVVFEDFAKRSDHNSHNNKNTVLSADSANVHHTLDDSFELRLTRLQSKLLEEAGMLDPATNDVSCENNENAEDCADLNKKKRIEQIDKDVNIDDSDAEDNLASSRVRAQRKFAANSSPSSSRGSSPVKMHKQKMHGGARSKKSVLQKERQTTRERAVRASSTSTMSDIVDMPNRDKNRGRKRQYNSNHDFNKNCRLSLFKEVPKTDTFLDYLCFRNTTVKVELHDCMKN